MDLIKKIIQMDPIKKKKKKKYQMDPIKKKLLTVTLSVTVHFAENGSNQHFNNYLTRNEYLFFIFYLFNNNYLISILSSYNTMLHYAVIYRLDK
jgi:hypothetical protein